MVNAISVLNKSIARQFHEHGPAPQEQSCVGILVEDVIPLIAPPACPHLSTAMLDFGMLCFATVVEVYLAQQFQNTSDARPFQPVSP